MDFPLEKYFGRNEPLSETEIGELSSALQRLAQDGVPIPKHLLRHACSEAPRMARYYGHTLDALPVALDRLGPYREMVVVGLIRRFERTVRDHHDHVKNRDRATPLDHGTLARYFDVAFFVIAAKPKTEQAVIQVSDFLRSDKDEVHEKASEMLQGAPYFPVIVDRLFENVATHGIRQWPNRQSRTLASFAYVPEVRLRLMNCFQSEEENLRYLAVMAFSYLKEDAGPGAESELFAIAEKDEDRLQSAAMGGLHAINSRSDRLRRLALRLVHSDKYWVRGTAIACLESFHDRESIDALLAALLDEGGPDFDNAGTAAKLLTEIPLEADRVLTPLVAALKTLLEREDRLYEQQADYRTEVQTLANLFKEAAERRGDTTEGLGVVTYASPETLLAVARVLGSLGVAAHSAIPLIEDCFKRPYVAAASDGEEWRKILKAIVTSKDEPDQQKVTPERS